MVYADRSIGSNGRAAPGGKPWRRPADTRRIWAAAASEPAGNTLTGTESRRGE